MRPFADQNAPTNKLNRLSNRQKSAFWSILRASLTLGLLALTISAPIFPVAPANAEAAASPAKSTSAPNESAIEWQKYKFMEVSMDCPKDAQMEESKTLPSLRMTFPTRKLLLEICEATMPQPERTMTDSQFCHNFYDNSYPPESADHKVIKEQNMTLGGSPAYEIIGTFSIKGHTFNHHAITQRKGERAIFMAITNLEEDAAKLAPLIEHYVGSIDFNPTPVSAKDFEKAVDKACSKEAISAALATGWKEGRVGNWHFTYPQDWNPKQTSESAPMVMNILEGLITLALVEYELNKGENTPLSEIAAWTLKDSSPGYADSLKGSKEEATKINGHDAYHILATGTIYGTGITKDVYVARAGDHITGLAFKAPTKIYDEFSPILHKFVDSIRFEAAK
jgi:hypothetical protein